MNTETGRRSSAKFHAERCAAGWTKRTTWFDPASSAKLEALKQSIGSYDEAIRQAIMGWDPEVFVALSGTIERHDATGSSFVQIGPVEPKPGSRLKVKR